MLHGIILTDTFSAVGVIALGIFVVLFTNAIRRCRAQKFDREIAEGEVEVAHQPALSFWMTNTARTRVIAGEAVGTGMAVHVGITAAVLSWRRNRQLSDLSSHGMYSQYPMPHEAIFCLLYNQNRQHFILLVILSQTGSAIVIFSNISPLCVTTVKLSEIKWHDLLGNTQQVLSICQLLSRLP